MGLFFMPIPVWVKGFSSAINRRQGTSTLLSIPLTGFHTSNFVHRTSSKYLHDQKLQIMCILPTPNDGVIGALRLKRNLA